MPYDLRDLRGRGLQYPLSPGLAVTGARWSELTSVTWGLVDLRNRVLVLHPSTTKNGRVRALPLEGELVDVLEELEAVHARRLGERPGENALVFVSPLWRPWQPQRRNALRVFYRLLEAAGIERRDSLGRQLDIHALRTTFGTRLARRGVPLATAQKILGHSTPALTAEHYTRLAVDDLREGVAAIARRRPGGEAAGAASPPGEWSQMSDSNRRPLLYESSALPLS